MRDPDHIAVKYYKDYHSGSAKTLKSIQITLAARLEKFNLSSLEALTDTDELDLPSLGEKKVALFALIPDNDTSFNFLVSILYTQLFQQLFYLADHKYGGSLPVPVHFLMDEFANVSLPDDFDKILSVMRSRRVLVSIILQNLAQLKTLFEKQWESIVGNCDEFLYLGGNEQSTHKYVSEFLGKATIDTNTYGKSLERNGNYSTNYQISGRELMTPDEVRMLDNRCALLFIRGELPIMDEKYDILKHPNVSLEEARTYFSRVGADLISHFAALGSKCTELDAGEKLRVLHDFYRQDEEAAFHFDPQDMMKKRHDFKDYICLDSMEKNSDSLRLGEKYCRVLFLKDYASYIKDSMVTELTDFNRNMMLSIDVVPVPTDEAVREVENRLLGVETNITNWQRRQNANNNFFAAVPYDMELQRKESKEFLDDLTMRDQRMMFAVITMVITADDKKQLDSDTETVLSVARKHMCQLAVLKFQQFDGLNTVLPIGTRKINAFRTLTTESLAVFMLFKVQEVQDKGGIYFGENAISHNLIMCNKANLLNQSAFLLGVPGSGKSFSAKELIAFMILNTEDDVLICDPENEFGALAAALGEETSTVIHMAAGGKDRLNAMYMVDGYGENNPIVEKSQFIMSLVEQIDRTGVDPQQKCSIIYYIRLSDGICVPLSCHW